MITYIKEIVSFHKRQCINLNNMFNIHCDNIHKCCKHKKLSMNVDFSLIYIYKVWWVVEIIILIIGLQCEVLIIQLIYIINIHSKHSINMIIHIIVLPLQYFNFETTQISNKYDNMKRNQLSK